MLAVMTDRDGPLVLHLLRHAHAGDPETWQGPDDLRPLSKRGRRQAERLGAFLAEHGIRPDVIVSSPKLRAQQTAERVAEALGLRVELDDRLAGGYDLGQLEDIVLTTGGHAPMLVGHDPDLSIALARLVGGSGLTMRKGALATLEVRRPFRTGNAMLRWLLPPELLETP
jgi:phosphohistidine phosphatase